MSFSGAGSSGSGTLRYAWNFGDGETSSEANPSHTFAEPGVYRVTLSVADDSGDAVNASLTVRVNNAPPVATIFSPATGTRYTVGDAVPFSGRGVDPEQGELPESALSWSVKMHHNDHAHLDGLPPTTGAAGSFVAEDHGDNTWLELCLSATDAFDEKGTDCVSLYPNTVNYTLDTVPTGLELPWEGAARKTPFTVTTNVNAAQQLIAPAHAGYTFDSWSDGGAASHSVRVGSTAKRLVATYQGSGSTPPSPTQHLGITALCKNRWLVRNPLPEPVRYSWKILNTGRKGSRTAAAGSERRLWLPSRRSRVTFYTNGTLYGTLRPIAKPCR